MTDAAMAPSGSGSHSATHSGRDVLELLDYAWARFTDRMSGLADDELRWQPTADDRITLRWRLDHVAATLTQERNATWLRVPDPGLRCGVDSGSGADPARETLERAFQQFRTQAAAVGESEQDDELGEV